MWYFGIAAKCTIIAVMDDFDEAVSSNFNVKYGVHVRPRSEWQQWEEYVLTFNNKWGWGCRWFTSGLRDEWETVHALIHMGDDAVLVLVKRSMWW